MKVNCQYCKKQTQLITGDVLYGRPDLAHKWFYFCKDCDAYVGSHPDKRRTPLGKVANAELRTWRRKAHFFLDKLWQDGQMTRHEAYRFFRDLMGMTTRQAHIGKFDVEQCQEAVKRLTQQEEK